MQCRRCPADDERAPEQWMRQYESAGLGLRSWDARRRVLPNSLAGGLRLESRAWSLIRLNLHRLLQPSQQARCSAAALRAN